MNKTREQHLEHLQKLYPNDFGLPSPPSSGSVGKSLGQIIFDYILEILEFDSSFDIYMNGINKAMHYVLDKSGVVIGIRTNNTFYNSTSYDKKFREYFSIELKSLSTKFYPMPLPRGELWGMKWYLDENMTDNEFKIFDSIRNSFMFSIKPNGDVYLQSNTIVEIKI